MNRMNQMQLNLQTLIYYIANRKSQVTKSQIANRVCLLCEVEKRHWVADLYLFWFGAEEEHQLAFKELSSNSTIVAFLISRPSSKHGFRRDL
ncbi:hypothetical protein RIF29_14399 [Crotalaria pallida]|uniref:Uncharacterized protein n=1 Tax=Crotalaria pallida TaxID=3830 RepID=A0AAN9FDC2_CROPI